MTVVYSSKPQRRLKDSDLGTVTTESLGWLTHKFKFVSDLPENHNGEFTYPYSNNTSYTIKAVILRGYVHKWIIYRKDGSMLKLIVCHDGEIRSVKRYDKKGVMVASIFKRNKN